MSKFNFAFLGEGSPAPVSPSSAFGRLGRIGNYAVVYGFHFYQSGFHRDVRARRSLSWDGIITGRIEQSERDIALIDQHQRRHAGDGLGDGVNREGGVRSLIGVPVSTSRFRSI